MSNPVQPLSCLGSCGASISSKLLTIFFFTVLNILVVPAEQIFPSVSLSDSIVAYSHQGIHSVSTSEPLDTPWPWVYPPMTILPSSPSIFIYLNDPVITIEHNSGRGHPLAAIPSSFSLTPIYLKESDIWIEPPLPWPCMYPPTDILPSSPLIFTDLKESMQLIWLCFRGKSLGSFWFSSVDAWFVLVGDEGLRWRRLEACGSRLVWGSKTGEEVSGTMSGIMMEDSAHPMGIIMTTEGARD